MSSLRDLWRQGEAAVGGWLAIPSAVPAEAMARAGFDYVCVDLQHGAVGYADAVNMIQAILLGGSRPIARAPWNEPGIIGKVLDAGAEAVIVPMVNTAEEAEAAVAACRYPPDGARSHGPTVVGPRHPDGYAEWAADHVACIPMVETAEALRNLDGILAVPGVDAIYVGPSDLSISLGLPPGNNDDAPAFADALEQVVAGCAAAGVVAGIQSTGSLTPKRLAAGFRMVTVTTDLVAMRKGVASELAEAREEDTDGSGDGMY